MFSFTFLGLFFYFFVSTVYALPVNDAIELQQEQSGKTTSELISLLRNKRSPEPDPHHHRNKIRYHIHGTYEEPSYYVKPVSIVQPVAVKPVPVIQQVPVVQPIAVKPVPVAQPVSTGCNVCGGGGYGGGGFGGGSHSQASSQASSNSFGGGGYSSSSAQSSSHAGSSGYGK